MQLYTIRGGSKEDLYAKKYNIGVGISLGNKWFTPENIVGLTEWALEHTREYVVVYVADSIHAINVEVRNGVTATRALSIARRKGKEILQKTEESLREKLPPEEMRKISFATWDDVVTEEYREKIAYLHDEYRTNCELRDAIHAFARNYTSGEAKYFTPEDINRLGMYIVEELPELLSRVPIRGRPTDAYAYPFDSDVNILVEKIQKGELFPEIREKIMDTEPRVFLEVR